VQQFKALSTRKWVVISLILGFILTTSSCSISKNLVSNDLKEGEYLQSGGKTLGSIKRSDINEQWAHSGIVEAGDFAFISYCVGNIREAH